jgi:predicted kinase
VATSGPIIIVSGPAGVGKTTVSRLVAASFDRSVHLQVDELMASVVSGWVAPDSPDAVSQNLAIGGALAASAMTFAEHGYTTVVDGHLFPDGVRGLADAGAMRRLSCHYVVLMADLDTCWARARNRGEGRWPLEREPFEALHTRFAGLDLPRRCVVEASEPPDRTRDALVAAFHAGRLIVGADLSTP